MVANLRHGGFSGSRDEKAPTSRAKIRQNEHDSTQNVHSKLSPFVWRLGVFFATTARYGAVAAKSATTHPGVPESHFVKDLNQRLVQYCTHSTHIGHTASYCLIYHIN